MRLLIASLLFLALTNINASCQSVLAGSLTLDSSDKPFAELISSLDSKRIPERKLVKRLFVRAHKDFLRHYKAYSQVNDIFEKGYYDCLSGTYFLARALDELGVSYKIYETNYHVFLTVKTRSKDILLESTDRYNGFVTSKSLIKEKMAKYQQIKLASETYLSGLRMFHELLPSQLPGLLYFNQAVKSFNQNNLSDCCAYLEQAWKIYDNPRIEAFAPILLRSIEASSLENPVKEKLASLVRSHQQSALHSLASR